MGDLGYGSHSSIPNLQTIFFVLASYFLRVIIIVFVYLAYKMGSKKPKFYENWVKILFFGEIFAISIEGYFEFLISGYLQY